jgi:hypothetical protein
MSEELINEKLNTLNSLTGIKPGRPTIPVFIAVQEAEDLLNWCTKDKEVLIRAGLNWKLVEDLPVRIGALRVSQSKWKADYKQSQDCQSEWGVAVRAAYILRDELVHHFFHAFYNNQDGYSKVQRIDKGNSSVDMIQDLMDLAELGLKHTAELKAIGLDLSLPDKARAKSFELTRLLGMVNSARSESNPKRELRNKAYAHLKEAVFEIRRLGQYAFWRNDDRLKGYVSPYLRSMNQKSKKKENGAAVVEVTRDDN